MEKQLKVELERAYVPLPPEKRAAYRYALRTLIQLLEEARDARRAADLPDSDRRPGNGPDIDC
jgi:hypothetical protein